MEIRLVSVFGTLQYDLESNTKGDKDLQRQYKNEKGEVDWQIPLGQNLDPRNWTGLEISNK